MSVHRPLSAAALLAAFALVSPATAHASAQPTAAAVTTLSTGRLAGSAAALIAVLGVVVGALAVARVGRFGTRASDAVIAAVAGLTGMVVGGFVVLTADGGLGTGNGLGGGVVAMTVGLIGMVLGGTALIRFRRAG
ncbi:DUF6223 family protein [Nocardia sp. CY41]|uniref:DUF6223 family protein n=1 Tax=Nocardia sp. CY41 TaxID=2608686 RepID=UPI001357D42D|nr:DUF6223 family protein [Nocardia sp. CY41]